VTPSRRCWRRTKERGSGPAAALRERAPPLRGELVPSREFGRPSRVSRRDAQARVTAWRPARGVGAALYAVRPSGTRRSRRQERAQAPGGHGLGTRGSATLQGGQHESRDDPFSANLPAPRRGAAAAPVHAARPSLRSGRTARLVGRAAGGGRLRATPALVPRTARGIMDSAASQLDRRRLPPPPCRLPWSMTATFRGAAMARRAAREAVAQRIVDPDTW
jgi:hypothetical protein